MDLAEPISRNSTTLSLAPYIGKTIVFISISSYMVNTVNGVTIYGNYITDSSNCDYELLYSKYWATHFGNERMIAVNTYKIHNINNNSYINMKKTFSDSNEYIRGFVIY